MGEEEGCVLCWAMNRTEGDNGMLDNESSVKEGRARAFC